MNSLAQANAQVDVNGNPAYTTYSYNPQENTYTADYSAFGLTGSYATETFTAEEFLANNDRTFSSMEGYEPLEDTAPAAEEDAFNIIDWHSSLVGGADFEAQLQIKKDYAFSNFDPNRGALAGTNLEGWARDQLIGLPFLELVREHSLPQSRPTASTFEVEYPYDYDGDNLYMKVPETGGNTDMYQGFSDEEREKYRDLEDRGYFLDISGGVAGVGEYAMMWFEDPPEESTWDTFLNNPITSIIAWGIPFGTAALTAIKAASGQTLHASDWASLVSGGLEAAGIIQPPTVTGGVEVSGTGLMGTTYQQTQNIITAAGAGDFTGVISTMVGGDLLGTLGFDATTIEGWAEASGITSAAMSEGLAGILSDVATGESLGNAIFNSGMQVLIDDFRNNGTFSEALLDGVGSLGDMLEEWGTALDDSVLAPFLDTVGDVADALPLEEIINGFSDIAGTLTDAVADGLGAVTSGVLGTVGALLPEGDAYIVNAFDDLASTTGESIESLLASANLTLADLMEASDAELIGMYNTVNELAGHVGDLIGGGEGSIDYLSIIAEANLGYLSEATGLAIEDLVNGAGSNLQDLADATGVSIEDLLANAGTSLEDLATATGQSIDDLVSGAGTSLEDLATATGVSIEALLSTSELNLAELRDQASSDLVDLSSATGASIDDLISGAGTSLENLAEATGQTIEEMLAASGTSLEELASATGQSIEDLVSGAGANLQDLADATGSTIDELLGQTGTALSDLINETDATLGSLVTEAGTSIDNLVGTAASDLNNLANTAATILEALSSDTGTSLEELIAGTGTTLEALASATGQSVEALLGGAENSLADLAEATGQSIEDLVSGAGANLDDLATATGQTLDELLGGTGNALEDMLSSAEGQLGDLVSATGESIDAITEGVQQGLADLTGATGEALEAMQDTAQAFYDSVEGQIDDAINQGGSDFGENVLNPLEGILESIMISVGASKISQDEGVAALQVAINALPTRTSDELFEFIGSIEDTQKMVDFDDDPFKPNYNGLF